MIPALQKSSMARVEAIASREWSHARQVSEKFKIPRAHDGYMELLNDPSIEAVYIPLPNNLHVPWAIKALQAGKHVLCEKPIALDSTEATYLQQVANGFPHLKIMEAFMYRFHPQWVYALDLVKSGSLGRLKTIHSFFSFFDDNPQSISNQKSLGGGSLMDIGCYCISLSRYLFERQPVRVQGILEYDPRLQIERKASVIMDFSDCTATFTSGMQLNEYQVVEIFGTKGHLRMEEPFITPVDRAVRMIVHNGEKPEEITFGPCDQYLLQAEGFMRAIREGTAVPVPLTDAVENMVVLDAVIRSGADQDWVKIL